MIRHMNNSIAKQRYISFNLFPTWKQPVSSKGTGCFKHGNNPFLTSGHMLAISLVFLMLLSGISKAWGQTTITSLGDIGSTGDYVINADIDASGFSESIASFSGTLEAAIDPITHMPYRIKNLGAPLFSTLTGTVKNIVIESVSISGHDGNTGAIACTANSDEARIYNVGILSGQVGGTGNTGGLVGLLGGKARVVNCYSFATITSGSNVGGIVGNNNATTTAASINTMVMNCMFYGDITGGTTVSPVFGGTNIANLQGGLNTYNYYAYDELTTTAISKDKYNSALAVEEKFLNRHEFYRLLLNSNKKLAAFYATGSAEDADTKMLKWVLETADCTIGNPKPYPVLKAQGYYPSIINPDFANAPDSTSVGRNHGGKLGKTLSVTISMPNTPTGGVGKPNDASLQTTSLNLQRTDKDFDRFNYNYDKVQLPYYNDVGTGNYTGNKAVTGWMITDITTITGDPYTADHYPTSGITDYPYHNYADRKSSNKDKYSISGRVFSQGAYFDVPYGVTSITIEPYWGNAIYVADQYYDVVYKNDYTGKQGVSQTGTQVANNAQFNSQNVKTSITGLGSGTTVYDNAVILVGNFHLDGVPSNGTIPFTMMSVDEDNDHEPDYSLVYHHKKRLNICPIRFDFLDVIGTAQAQKPNGASLICNFTICKTRGWFEITNTALIYSSQFEYENLGNSDGNDNKNKVDAPLILLGGVFDQFVSTQSSDVNGKVYYIHVGGNVWINEFGMGTHSDGSKSTPHVPVSVTGGEFPGFYLTGTYNASAAVRSDNAECYISGGYFHEAAGAAQEAINGNVRWQIYNADIDNFFGGGTNDAKPIQGDVTIDIYNSHVTLYCGGPKFGNMQTGKKVTTNAVGCTFGTCFGAGYGGLSYSRKKYFDNTSYKWADLQKYYYNPGSTTSHENERGKYYDGEKTNAPDAKYGKKGPGVATDFDYEFFVWSSGSTGARFFVKFASFSLAQCNDVESNLNKCTVETNFYGGGNLGKVVGTATSVLEDCEVKGSVYGGGYSASLPTVEVRDAGFTKNPNYNSASGMFEPGVFSGTTTFTWQNAAEAGVTLENGKSGSDLDNHILYTGVDLNTLGQVKNSDITIKGSTIVTGDVYGGGALASMDASGGTKVNLIGGTINGDVYGGGQGRLPGTLDEKGNELPEVAAEVGSVEVHLNKDVPNDTKGCVVSKRIFGCNNLNGTPKGSVTVHVYKTQNASASRITNVEDEDNPENSVTTAKQKGVYDVKAVYGGGNLAAYEPTDLANAKAHVIIDGCGLTSIETVYGGGNAASAPATLVEVNGTYEIEELFGGGNGKDAIDENTPNPGAHVGYQAYPDNATYEQRNNTDPDAGPVYIYGTGRAQVNINGGTVHAVYGGSNTKGNVREIALAMLEEISDADGLPVCDFHVDEAYGGGKSAPMDGEARLEMKCIPGMTAAYGGSRNADVNSGVTLNITNGKFEKVFGGNNEGGCVKGSITVNIEETGCRPVEIGELYGGGNQAAYSKYGYKEVSVTDPETSETTTKWVVIESPTDSQALTGDDVYDDPQVNVKSFTSIGSVFGGGLGATATMVADPHVNINQVYGKQYDSNTPKKFVDPATTLGTIGTVYGGGNAAPVIGDTYVNVGTKTTIDYVTIDTTKGETEAVTGINVVGANITGNVYGGGNAAKVTGRTKVTIGKEESGSTGSAPENTTPDVNPEP